MHQTAVIEKHVCLFSECKIPIRFWIACMVFFTTYINYTARVNMSISIVSMTTAKNKTIAECKKNEMSAEEIAKPVSLPNVSSLIFTLTE